ncbi:MAG: hypothetical protein HKO62_14330, partial [Gammaproteobacteria bacterium]|nr:hypothetical protein [Gammaproteobacteria bacterium]
VGADRFPHTADRRRFWINLPRIISQRLRVVLRVAWRQSRLVTLISLPFLLLTMSVWALAVCAGKGQPAGDVHAPR